MDEMQSRRKFVKHVQHENDKACHGLFLLLPMLTRLFRGCRYLGVLYLDVMGVRPYIFLIKLDMFILLI